MPDINPQILQWARETSGMSIDDAAKALGIRVADRLRAIEAGEKQPTRPMLLKMSKQYRRPLLTFYLSAPPRRGDRGQDFRTLPPDRSIQDEAVLDALIRDLNSRQDLVRSLIEDDDDAASLPFIGSMTMEDGSGAVCNAIRDTIGIDLARYRSARTTDEAFSYLRDRVEAAGVFVLLVGNLGSYHTAIPVEAFRGFAIADPLAPFVVINDQDARPAWSFTLLHELAHLWLGTTGVSGTRGEQAIERFCNDVAGDILLPAAELADLDVTNATAVSDAIAVISAFARARNLSRPMVAYKLFRESRLSWGKWNEIDATLRQMWRTERENQKDQRRQSESGPNYYVVRRHRLGKALLDLVDRNMTTGSLTPVKASKVLGVKPRTVYSLLLDLPRHAVTSAPEGRER